MRATRRQPPQELKKLMTVRIDHERMRFVWRRGLGVLALLAICVQSEIALADDVLTFDIPHQGLASALGQFAHQSDRQILFSTQITADKQTAGIKGRFEPEAALRLLLKGTGLTYRVTSDHTILVESVRAGETSNAAAASSVLEEVVVTAQRRSEDLQRVPAAITAITSQRLDELNAQTFQDYFRDVPGLALIDTG